MGPVVVTEFLFPCRLSFGEEHRQHVGALVFGRLPCQPTGGHGFRPWCGDRSVLAPAESDRGGATRQLDGTGVLRLELCQGLGADGASRGTCQTVWCARRFASDTLNRAMSNCGTSATEGSISNDASRGKSKSIAGAKRPLGADAR